MLLVKANITYSAIPFSLSGNKLESIYLFWSPLVLRKVCFDHPLYLCSRLLSTHPPTHPHLRSSSWQGLSLAQITFGLLLQWCKQTNWPDHKMRWRTKVRVLVLIVGQSDSLYLIQRGFLSRRQKRNCTWYRYQVRNCFSQNDIKWWTEKTREREKVVYLLLGRKGHWGLDWPQWQDSKKGHSLKSAWENQVVQTFIEKISDRIFTWI